LEDGKRVIHTGSVAESEDDSGIVSEEGSEVSSDDGSEDGSEDWLEDTYR